MLLNVLQEEETKQTIQHNQGTKQLQQEISWNHMSRLGLFI